MQQKKELKHQKDNMAITTITNAMVSVNAIQGTLIADNAITAVHIATNAVSGTLIADNAVTATHIAQNTITVTQLADDAVEADKIADGVITTNHLNKAMISSQTEVAVATGDFILLGDTSDSNNLKKAPISSIVTSTLASPALTGTVTAASHVQIAGNLDVVGQIAAYDNAGSAYGAMGLRATNYTFKNSGGTVKVAIDSDGRVLIGQGSNIAHANLDDLQVGAGSGHSGITVYSGTSSYGSLSFADGTSGTAQYSGLIEYNHNGNTMGLYTGGSQKVTILNDGKVGINETGPQGWLDIGTTHGVAKEVALRITNADYPNYGWDIWRDNTTGHLNFAHEDAGTDSTRVTFKAQGSVGIGTTDPDAMLEIVSSDPRIRLRDDTAGGGAGNGGQIEFVGYHAGASDGKREFARIKGLKENSTGGDTDGYLSFLVNQGGTLTESMHLDSNGLVGIGTDTPGTVLDVNSPGSTYWCIKANTVNSDYGFQARGQGNYAYACLDTGSNAYRGRWTYNGTLYTQDGSVHDIDSDERLKEDITDCPSQWSLIKDLPLQRFKWKDRRNGDTFSYGWIAQPTKAKYPEFVEPIPQPKEDIDEGKEDPEYLTVRSGDIQKRSIAALQEAMARIEALETEVAALKG